MGEDKALLPFGNFDTLTEFQLSRLSKLFSNVYISCKDKNKFNFEANFLEDDSNIDTFAPTAGFISAFKHLKEESFFAISVDSPFINLAVIKKLIAEDKETQDAIVAKTQNGVQPLCGIYHRSLERSFQDMQTNGNHRLGQLLKSSHTQYIHFDDEQIFLNLNNPEDYKEALSLL